MNPVKINKENLINILKAIVELIEKDDSFEGSVCYSATEKKGVFDVTASFRHGNSEGQGGMIVIDGEG